MKRKDKAAKTPDFLIEQLPSTRRKQFFDIVKNEWRTLLALGAALFVFFLPFIISNICEAGFMNGTAEAIRQEMGSEGKTAEEIASRVQNQMTSIHLLFNGINILCFMLFSLGLAGASRIIKCFGFGEGVLFKSDFFAGIKKYWKAFLLCGFFAGLFYFLISYVYAVLNPAGQESAGINILSGVTIGFYYAIIVPLLLFSLAQATLYELPFFKNLANSLRFTIVRYHFTAIFALVIYGVSLLTMIVYPVTMILSFAAFIVLLAPFFALAFHLFALSLFDRYINEDHYPSIYKKGLYIKEGKGANEKDSIA